MRLKVAHTTVYTYGQPVPLCHNEVRLAPRDTPLQRCHYDRLLIKPTPANMSARTDYFGNRVHCFALEDGHQKLSITAISKVEVNEPTAEMTYDDTPWEQVRERLASDRSTAVLDAYQFTFASPHVPLLAELADYAAPSFPSGAPLTPSVLDLTRRIHADFVYDSTATTISTPLDEVLALRRGVCQDFAQLQIGCLRSLGLAARYVSGYLLTTPPPGRKKLRGADASHAWLSVYLPSGHWLDVDPTNDLIPSDSHITLAWGRDYSDVCPIKGVFVGGGQHSMSVAVDVTAVDGEPDSY